MKLLRTFALAVAAALGGCAALDRHFDAHLQSEAAPVRECAQWYRALDEAIDAEGVRDAQYTRIAGFPYLRVDRLLASLGERAGASEAAFQAFAERLRDLELEARRYEIENLPPERLGVLPGARTASPQSAALRQSQDCSRLLREIDLAKPQLRAVLLQSARVPDDYSSASRALGLYPISRLPFIRGVRRAEDEMSAAFQSELSVPPGASLVRYAPPLSPPIGRAAVAAVLERTQLDALGHPVLSERELVRLAAAYAPSFEIAISADYDRFGQLRWRRDATVPSVDAAQAAVYVHPAYTRYRDGNGSERILLQLVYTIWFPERPSLGQADLLAGALDGVVWRATLAPDGEPVLYDSIHPCGCYHQFFPTARAKPRPAPDPEEEWAFVPQSLPRVAEGERPVVRIASRTHYIERVSLARGGDSVARYVLRDYNELRSLPKGGGRRSVFGPDGLIAGTERAERFLFWPMGIDSAGAMRQWGRHATAFVGRRHFDDADLLERRFELDLTEPLQ
jgi:hypothetical protein